MKRHARLSRAFVELEGLGLADMLARRDEIVLEKEAAHGARRRRIVGP